MIPTPDQISPEDLESLTLQDLGLAKRPHTILTQHQVAVSQLVAMTVDDLLAYPGLGEGSVHKIAASLKRRGLFLRPSPPTPRQERHQRARERGLPLRDRWFAGETLAQIAVSVGLSTQRVYELILRADPNAIAKRKAAAKAKVEERGLPLRDRWLAGETLAQIAPSVGVSPDRVRQLILDADRDAMAKRFILRAAARGKITPEEVKQLFDRLNPGAEREEKLPDATWLLRRHLGRRSPNPSPEPTKGPSDA